MKCNLPSCPNELDDESHGNLRFCCYEHTLEAKKINNKLQYQKRSERQRLLTHNESVLRSLYTQLDKNGFIDVSHLNNMNMNWSCYSLDGIIENTRVKIIGNYAYALFHNLKVKIWKI